MVEDFLCDSCELKCRPYLYYFFQTGDFGSSSGFGGSQQATSYSSPQVSSQGFEHGTVCCQSGLVR